MRAFVMRHREALGWVLLVLVLGVMALDWFVGRNLELGRNLPLRLVYATLSCLIVGYVYTLATANWQLAEQRR